MPFIQVITPHKGLSGSLRNALIISNLHQEAIIPRVQRLMRTEAPASVLLIRPMVGGVFLSGAVTGYSLNAMLANGFYTVKYAAIDGAVLWEKPHHFGPANLADVAYAVAVDGAGNVGVTGGSGGDC